MTIDAPRAVARLLLLPCLPETAASLAAETGASHVVTDDSAVLRMVLRSLRRYAPDRARMTETPAAVRAAAVLGRVTQLGAEVIEVTPELVSTLEALAAQSLGSTTLLIAERSQMVPVLCRAMGIEEDAATAIAIEPLTLSLLEIDADGRWAVIRLNEGRRLPGEL